MKETCPSCYSDKTKQKDDILTRILVSVYIFLGFLFFTGRINFQSLFALTPFVIPFKNVCLNCNNIFYVRVPKWKKSSVIEINTSLNKWLLAIAPSILVISLLIVFFPYTGLGRIIYLPFIFLLNSAIISISLILARSLKCTIRPVAWTIIILLTLVLTIVFYPQESGTHVIKEIIS